MKDKMELFQPCFPSSVSGRGINFLMVIRINGICAVTKVTHQRNQIHEVIAGCKIIDDFNGRQVFITEAGDTGHKALCKLLSKKGINGSYLTWLYAVENKDDETAKQNRGNATISFGLSCVSEKGASEWTLNLNQG